MPPPALVAGLWLVYRPFDLKVRTRAKIGDVAPYACPGASVTPETYALVHPEQVLASALDPVRY